MIAIAAFVLACTLLGGMVKAANSGDTSRKPYLLVASPDMPDPTFQQAVILMLPATDPPLVAGIVINKPTKMTLGQLFSHSDVVANNKGEAVYFGGPVDLTSAAMLIRTDRAPSAATHLFDDAYMSVDAASIRQLLKGSQSCKDCRLFLGRAQWTADQLQSEILRGAWITSPATTELLFNPDPASVWPALKQRAKLHEIRYDREWQESAFGLSVVKAVDYGGESRLKTLFE